MVYERENGLRIMMKMHGLSDMAYWTISYLYYYVLYVIYIAVFLLISSLAGLAVITENDYGNYRCPAVDCARLWIAQD